jgi:ComF family protein
VLRDTLASLVALLLPPRCAACDAALGTIASRGLCTRCAAQLPKNIGARCGRCDLPGADPCARCTAEPPPYASLRAPYLYGGPVAALVQRAKFSRREDVALVLGDLLAEEALPSGVKAIVPVPLGARRRRERGFNQSAVLARVVAERTGVALRHALRRPRETVPQSGLGLAERRTNVREAFTAPARLTGAVVLVDDVVTSGSTVEAATQALLAAGASAVHVLALARAPL